MKIKLTALVLSLLLLLCACASPKSEKTEESTEKESVRQTEEKSRETETDTTEAPSATEEDITPEGVGEPIEELGAYDGYFDGESEDLDLECLMGTKGAYKLEGSTLTFTKIDRETVYVISGKFRGNIVIDVGEGHKFELEFRGFSMVSDEVNPITVLSGEEVALKAKKGYDNYIYDEREAIDPLDETLRAGAISSEVDLEIGGKGKLTVLSRHNNGIHTKDDLQVKNLTLLVACTDNALKGNDSVSLTEVAVTLIATDGDGIKTSSTDFSPKGKQRGSVTLAGGTHTVYASSDGIDAAYNVIIGGSTTCLTVYTDRYSNYSREVITKDRDGEITPPSTRSAKGICAGNVVVINDGTVHIRSYSACIDARKDTVLENGASPIGNITVNGGSLTLSSCEIGIHADGTLKTVSGTIDVINSYEGFEAAYVDIYGGDISINAEDDGINATASEEEGVRIRGGSTYIYSRGDGIDSNSGTEYRGVAISGGRTVIITDSDSNSAIDTEAGYAYEGGSLIAVMHQNFLAEQAVRCMNFESVGKSAQMPLSAEAFVVARIGAESVTVRIPSAMSAVIVVLGDPSSEIEVKASTDAVIDRNGVAWQ